MSATLQALVREVSNRRGDLILATPTSAGTSTTLISLGINPYFPKDITQLYLWVYGTATGSGAVDVSNQGVEQRSTSWTAASNTLTLFPPGMPTAILSLTGVWEMRRAKSRTRVVEAVNSAVGQLGYYCTREFKDETLVATQNQWRYTLPSPQNWERITNIEIQQSLTYADYPYRDARQLGLNWRPERTTDESGNTLWQIQFASQPPPGYIIRVWGEAYYPDLSLETDVLSIEAEHDRMVREWVYDWALFKLDAEQAEAWASGDSAKAMQLRESNLQRVKAQILEQCKPPKPGRINTPLTMIGRGWSEDPNYLGAFTSGGIANAPYSPSL